MKNTTTLIPSNYYHIYTKGVNSCDLFLEDDDYNRFLTLLDRYIEPIANIFAWCLMKNHLHLLIQVSENIGYKFFNRDRSEELKWETQDLSLCEPHARLPNPSRHFAHLFNAYTKPFNAKHNRKGNLFQRPFKRKQIDNLIYFKRVVTYIHHNPIHHGFSDHPMEYPWSSYLTCITYKSTKVKRETIIGWFDNLVNFKDAHEHKLDVFQIEKWLEI